MKNSRVKQIVLVLFAFGMCQMMYAQPAFNSGQDPVPEGKKWVKVEDLSDEFDGASLDESKWENTDPNRWIGRAPGIFKKDVVSLSDGNLYMTNYLLSSPEVVNGNTFTHAGGNIYSKNSGMVGYYFECKMKASQTFMSSTFWLINTRSEGTGCDVRTTELDIQECVGQITTTATWAQKFDHSINSNTHSRNTICPETPTGSQGDHTSTGSKVWEDYHVYGCWWKNPREVEIYLDGEKAYTIIPKADFDLPMYLRLVSETYNWNAVPEDGGMNGSWEERTTSYDWVRTWKLEDDMTTNTSSPTPDRASINIYPNPATDYVIVSAGTNNMPTQIRIFDIYGQLMTCSYSKQYCESIPLQAFQKGLYVVEVHADGRVQYEKFLIQ